MKNYAPFHPHFYKSISVPSKLLYIDKNLLQKFCVLINDMSVIFFFGKLLSSSLRDSLVSFGYGHTKMRVKKCILFRREAKT